MGSVEQQGGCGMTTEFVVRKQYPDNSRQLEIVERYLEAQARNAPLEEIREITKDIPIDPRHALFMKEHYGKEFLIREKFNLSRANAKYGEGWLDA
jgi:hypothetical protein